MCEENWQLQYSLTKREPGLGQAEIAPKGLEMARSGFVLSSSTLRTPYTYESG